MEQEPDILTEEEMETERETGIPTIQPNTPPVAFARLVQIESVGAEIDGLLPIGTKIYIPHYAGDIIDEGIRIIGVNSVLAID